MIQKLKNTVRQGLATTLPKSNRVLILDNLKAEANAVVFANYVAEHCGKPVYFVVKKSRIQAIMHLFHKNVHLLELGSRGHFIAQMTCRYIFTTHGHSKSSKRQLYINLWHGAGYKKRGKARGMHGFYSDVTVATSKVNQKMLADGFSVPLKSVYVSGCPRNDQLLRS